MKKKPTRGYIGVCPESGKIKYLNQAATQKAIADVRRNQRATGERQPNLRPYPCPHCGAWHMTSSIDRNRHRHRSVS